jgi:hypothetical protein
MDLRRAFLQSTTETLARWVVVSAVVLGILVATPTRAAAQAPITKLVTSSDPGDFIGEGGSHSFTPSDGSFFANASAPTTGALADTVEVIFNSGDHAQSWQLRFSTRAMGKPLSPGYYDKAEREPFADPGHPGLEINANGYGCNVITGNFRVIDAAFDYSVSQIRTVSFAVQFEQHCDAGPAALRGTLYYNYTPPLIPAILTSPGLPNTQVGHPYSVALFVVGGTPPISWAISGGQLPPGIALTSDGELQGTPTQSGTFAFAVRVSDAAGHSSQSQFSVEVSPQTTRPPVSELVLKGSPNGYLLGDRTLTLTPNDGQFVVQTRGSTGIQVNFHGPGIEFWLLNFSTQRLIRRDLTPGYYPDAMRWPFEDPGHPGLDVEGEGRGCNEVTGNFTILDSRVDFTTGTPTVLSFAATFEDHCEGGPAAVTGHIYYNYEAPIEPTIVSFSPLPEAALSTPYADTLVGAGGTAPYTWQLAGGSLPPGLTLHSDGRIDGTPTASGDFAFTVAISDTLGHTSQSSRSLPVIVPVRPTSPSTLPDAIAGRPYSADLAASGGTPPYKFSLAPGNLGMPDGVSLSEDGAITGLPLVSSTYYVGIRVKDSEDRYTDAVLKWKVTTPDGHLGTRQLTMSSDGEYIGGGYNYFYGEGNGQWNAYPYVRSSDGQVNDVRVTFDSTFEPGVFWDVEFSTRGLGTPLVPGVYNGAQRAAFAEPGHPGLDITGEGRGCNTVTGDFTVLDAKFDYSGASPRVISFAAKFEEHCEGGSGTLRGTVFFGSVPPPPSNHAPFIRSAGFNPTGGKLTVRGDNFDSQCTLLVDGNQLMINPNDPRDRLGPVLKVRGVSLQPGSHRVQVANVDGEVSSPFLLDL